MDDIEVISHHNLDPMTRLIWDEECTRLRRAELVEKLGEEKVREIFDKMFEYELENPRKFADSYEDVMFRVMGSKDGRVELGVVAVDSGQILMVDPCYFSNRERDEEGNDTYKLTPDWASGTKFDECFDAACSAMKAGSGQFLASGIGGSAVSVYTGDWVFPVYGHFNDKYQLVKIEINVG